MQEPFIINSHASLQQFINQVTSYWHEAKYLTFDPPRVGADRSLSQNSLFHVFCRDYAAEMLRKHKKDVTEGEIDGMKRIVKKHFYNETGHPWMVYELVDPFSGQKKLEFRSTAKLKTGEMFELMTWLQMKAMETHNLILESTGQFKKLQDSQHEK